MAKKFLHTSEIGTALQQVRRHCAPQGVRMHAAKVGPVRKTAQKRTDGYGIIRAWRACSFVGMSRTVPIEIIR